jgi:hypothetical protein
VSLFSQLAAEGLMAATLNTFGEAATFSPRAGDSYSITVAPDSGENVQTSTRVYMTAWAPLSSFTGGEPVKGDTITIGSILYRVADIEKDAIDGRLLKLAVLSTGS